MFVSRKLSRDFLMVVGRSGLNTKAIVVHSMRLGVRRGNKGTRQLRDVCLPRMEAGQGVLVVEKSNGNMRMRGRPALRDTWLSRLPGIAVRPFHGLNGTNTPSACFFLFFILITSATFLQNWVW
jgi:hypothetical protein